MLESRAVAFEEVKAGAGRLGGAFLVDDVHFLAEFVVGRHVLGHVTQVVEAPASIFLVVALVDTEWDALVRDLWNLEHALLEFVLQVGRFVFDLLDLVFELL